MTDWLPSEMINGYLLELDVRPDTKRTYNWLLRKFFIWTSDRRLVPSQLSRKDIIEYKNWMIRKGFSPFTINRYMAAVRSFFKWMDANGRHNNITIGVRRMKLPFGQQREIFTTTEWKQFLAQINRKTRSGMRDYAMFQLLIYTGLRSNEMRMIDVEDYYTSRGHRLMKVLAKGRRMKDTIIPIEPILADIIDQYLERMKLRAGHPLFPSWSPSNKYGHLASTGLSKLFKGYLAKAGLDPDKFTIHSIRHSAAAWIMNAGGSVFDIQRFLRHSNPNTTMIYLKSLKYKLGMENKGGKIITDLLNNNSEEKICEPYTKDNGLITRAIR